MIKLLNDSSYSSSFCGRHEEGLGQGGSFCGRHEEGLGQGGGEGGFR